MSKKTTKSTKSKDVIQKKDLIELENDYLKLLNMFSHVEKISDISNDQIKSVSEENSHLSILK